jgi:hypothetical protein
MSDRPIRLALLVLLAAPVAGTAQEFELPTPEEYAAAAERAANAPLFATHDLLRVTLRTDIDWLRDERSDSTEVEGTFTYVDADGSEVELFVNTRTRGNFRREKKNCNFPPLRLNFRTGELDGTVFEGQDRLKLVTPCNDGRDDYQRYIFNEYLAYRAFNVISDVSNRVRLLEITYEDINGEYDTRTKYAFVIESDEAMAARNRATLQEVMQFHPARTFSEYSVLAAMFNYMIANTDWSPAYMHNVKVIRTEDGRYLTVPYDFDSSGIVNARYATVDPSLQEKIRRVTQRLFRGFCRPELAHGVATAPFAERRAEIEALFTDFAAMGFENYDADDAKDKIEFLEDFWEVVDDPQRFERRILPECRDLQTGR